MSFELLKRKILIFVVRIITCMKVNLKVIVTLAILLAVVIATAGCISSSSSTNSGAGSGQVQPSPAQPSVVTGVVGDVIDSNSYDGHIQWSVSQVIRGNSANSIVESGNMFNQKPDAGYEYCLYQITISNIGSDKYSIYSLAWPLYANGVECSDYILAVLPSGYQSLNSGTLMPGATTSGWIVKQVPVGSNLRVYYEPMFGSGKNTCYIQL